MTDAPAPYESQPPFGLPRALWWCVVGVALTAILVLTLVPTLRSGGGAVPVVLDDANLVATPATDRLPDGAHLEIAGGSAGVDLVVDALPSWLSMLTAVGMALAGLLTLVGGWLIIRVLRDIWAGRPFTPANPKRLAALAVVVLAGALLPQLADNVAAALVLDHLGMTGLGYTIVGLNGSAILAVIAISILAGAFRHGQHLAADVEGLV